MTISETDGHFENEDGSVRVSKETGGWFFVARGEIRVSVTAIGENPKLSACVGIYGTPGGLLQLADLLTAIARIDQTQIADRNCPPDEGMHTTLDGDSGIKGPSVRLNIGRLDSKGDGCTAWLDQNDQVRWTSGDG